MGRGQFTLFDNIFTTKAQTPSEKKARQTSQFHEMVAHRYYYFIDIKKLRYDYVLQLIAKETFRSSETILDILSEKRQLVSEVVSAQPSIKDLRVKYPWLLWEA